MTEFDWLSVPELTNILPVGKRAIQQWPKRGKIDEEYYRYVNGVGRGGRELEIMPKGLMKKYRNIFKSHLAKEGNVDFSSDEFEMKRIADLKPYERKHLVPYYTLIKKKEQFGLKGNSWEQALDAYNKNHPGQKDIMMPSLYRNWQAYRKVGLDALIPGYGKRKGDTKIRDVDFKVFDELYMTQNRRSYQECWRKTLGEAQKKGTVIMDEGRYYMVNAVTGQLLDTFPHARTFKREIDRRYSEDAIILAREGERGLRKSQDDYFLNRDLTSIMPGEVWVSDHRQVDVQVDSSKKDIKRFVKTLLYDQRVDDTDRKQIEKSVRRAVAANFSGRPTRLWCTAWIDFKTGKWLSWYLHEDAPNTDHVLLSFKWAVEKYGIPKDIIIDNGKDYRARDVAGGRTYKIKVDIDETYTEGIMFALGITPHFAIPYNARAKIIEKAFQWWIESYEKDYHTYTGKNAADRPEITSINAKHGKFARAVDFIRGFGQFIQRLNQQARKGRHLDGLSPEAMWQRDFPGARALREGAMDAIAMRSSNVKKLVGNGFYDPDLDHHYYASWMAGYVGEKTFIRRDPEQWDEAIVVRASDGEVLGKASIEIRVPGLARTEEEKAAVAKRKAHQNKRRRILKSQLKHLKKVSPEEAQEMHKHYIELQNELIAYEHDLEGAGNDQVIEMQNTIFDEIPEKLEKLNHQRTGTDDLDDIVPAKIKKIKFKDILDPDE